MKQQIEQFRKPVTMLTNVDGALSLQKHLLFNTPLIREIENMWNLVLGTQFQLNKHWMIRAEYGFLGSEVNLSVVFNIVLDYKIQSKNENFLIAISFFFCSSVSNAQVLISLLFGEAVKHRQD